jgi:hypothetical protein
MSKLSELDWALGELRSAAQSLLSVADSLAELFSSSGEEEAQQPVAQPGRRNWASGSTSADCGFRWR